MGKVNNTIRNIIILGVGFDTGNLGISALAWSAIYLVKRRWPDAEIIFSGYSKKWGTSVVEVDNTSIIIHNCPIRLCKNIFVKNHFVKIALSLILVRLFPIIKSYIRRNDSTLSYFCHADYIFDITGGDSFSDIYGKTRFWFGVIPKILAILSKTKYILLPQTYGPFNYNLSKRVAKNILSRACNIYSRDRESIEYVYNLGVTQNITLCPDIAFCMKPQAVNSCLGNMIGHATIIGLNVSGLLYNGGYGRPSEDIEMRCDYKQLINDIISYFQMEGCKIVLVPHVIPEGTNNENDLQAIREICNDRQTQDSLYVAIGSDSRTYNHAEIKYIIGKCDFFIGSRMHATIAALSQMVPTLGLAYSRKFKGVYEAIEYFDGIADLKEMDNTQIMNKIRKMYICRHEYQKVLQVNMASVIERVNDIFNNLKY